MNILYWPLAWLEVVQALDAMEIEEQVLRVDSLAGVDASIVAIVEVLAHDLLVHQQFVLDGWQDALPPAAVIQDTMRCCFHSIFSNFTFDQVLLVSQVIFSGELHGFVHSSRFFGITVGS